MPFVDVLLFLEGFIIIKKGGNLSITTTNKTEDIMKSSQNLLEIVSTMEPKSARFLRKIPFQALMKVPELPAQLSHFLVALRDCCN